MQPKRLFDAVAYQLAHFPKENMMVAKYEGKWTGMATEEVQMLANRLSAGLLHLGVGAGDFTVDGADKIAIISNSRPEWLIADIAVQQTGAILVPIYPTITEEELAFILREAEVKFIFIGSQLLLHKYTAICRSCVTLKGIFSFDETSETNWKSLVEEATPGLLQEVEQIKSSVSEDHVATIIYTSGTTGLPKGVMLTHKNIVSCVLLSKASFPFPDNPGLRAISFLPLNHIFEKCLSYVYLFSGISIYFAEGLEKIGENIREVKPHIFTAVPRLLEKVFEKMMNAGYQLKGVKRELFFRSVDLAKKYDNRDAQSFSYRMKMRLADRFIFSKWRKALGGEVRYIITGGAACPLQLLRIFNAAQIPVYEGYGPTENSPVISVNRAKNNASLLGTVGPVIEGLQLKLAEDGEICVKGDTVMRGYYKNEALTAETVIDGWLHTGDIGTLVEEVYLKITDRKKELFKTSGGKYVAPQVVENRLRESPLIEQVMVAGSGQKYVSALIVPAFSALKEWMKQHSLTYENNEQAIAHIEVKKLFSGIIRQTNLSLSPTEQVKKSTLLPREWTIEAGELTPKLSLKRKIILEKYKNKIAAMYGQ